MVGNCCIIASTDVLLTFSYVAQITFDRGKVLPFPVQVKGLEVSI